MRPLRLDLAGFAVFREPTTLDFTDADFFALVGPTGSGKSTVLDAICFALYGTVPRWGDRRAIGNALAPSATEARVRLCFESANTRYVVTRVVRRDGKGAVATKHAGLEALPSGFDLASLDLAGQGAGLPAQELGEVLAGTPAELEAAVSAVVGLPYEQFTKCVVLPQGDFAAFLHAKPAERQRILVNLLGLDVYGKIRERANVAAAAAEAKAAVASSLLDSLADAGDAAIEAAERRVAVIAELVTAVDSIMPELAATKSAATEAAAQLSTIEGELSMLASLRPPKDVPAVTAAVTQTRSALAEASELVTLAEEREEKLRAELAGAGDPTLVRHQLGQHAEAGRLAALAEEAAAVTMRATADRDRIAETLATTSARAAAARSALEEARDAYQAALATDRAAALRQHLRPGQPCPVCERPVEHLPAVPGHPAVTAAKIAGDQARATADAADAAAAEADAALRRADLALARARTQSEQLAVRLTEVRSALTEVPDPAALHQQLESINLLLRRCEQATEAVRSARTSQRTATGRTELAQERLKTAWQAFDRARDAIAPLGPPGADRDDLVGAWQALTAWAAVETSKRRAAHQAAAASVGGAKHAVRAVGERIAALFSAAALPADPEAADPARTAAIALERAEAEHRRGVERRAEADRLRAQRAECELEARVARTLSGHLRADRFERWLLTEALDALVDGASQILRDLSAGQYDLGHEKGEFFVIDHYDAGLRRAVRTLSGGETFQASLALALALSQQLAGTAAAAAASLESILLDEGFGTLDASTLEAVASTLENLAAKGDRVVGVVTHVGALAERIPVRFEITRDARTARVERTGL